MFDLWSYDYSGTLIVIRLGSQSAAVVFLTSPTVTKKKTILIIIGSASQNSSNHKLADLFVKLTADEFNATIFNNLKTLPHFDPELSSDNPPAPIVAFRNLVEKSDAVVISTPEYVFSIPSGLKNAIEWCVSTVVFSDKPVGIITASGLGQKGHEELQLIMKTVGAKLADEATLLIPGVKGKINQQGVITDQGTTDVFAKFIDAFKAMVS